MQMEDLLYGAADASSYTGLMAVRLATENNQLVSDFAIMFENGLLSFDSFLLSVHASLAVRLLHHAVFVVTLVNLTGPIGMVTVSQARRC